MVLIDAEVVPGHAGVLPAVVRLSCVNLQRAVVVVDVRVSHQRAGPAVFEPGESGGRWGQAEFQLQSSYPLKGAARVH